LTLYTDNCKPVCQVGPPAVGVASNATSCGPHFQTAAVFTCDLVTLTSTSKWVTGHPWHGLPYSFLTIFSMLCSSILNLRSETGQTDGQTDNNHQHLMLPPYGGGGITYGRKSTTVFT